MDDEVEFMVKLILEKNQKKQRNIENYLRIVELHLRLGGDGKGDVMRQMQLELERVEREGDLFCMRNGEKVVKVLLGDEYND